MKKKKYFKIYGLSGTYILTEKEFERALDRENRGVKGEIIKEQDYIKHIKL